MSLNDLLPLLLLAAFVLNIFVRAQRQRRRGGGPRPGAPSRPGRPATPTAEAGPQRSGGRPSSQGGGERASSTLEEARRRVQEAMAEEAGEAPPSSRRSSSGGRGTGASGGAGQTGGRGTLSRPGGAPSPGGATLGREGYPPAPAAKRHADMPSQQGVPRGPRGPDVAPKVERRRSPAGSARLPAAKALGRSRADIVRGFVWSVVLGDSVATQRRQRRKVSPRR